MNQSLTAAPHGSVTAENETAATEHETREHLLTRAKRDAAPVLKDFVQDPDRTKTHRAGPLSVFVQHGDLRALRAFLFLHAIISSGEGDNGWSTTLPLSVWARAFDTTATAEPRSASTAATKLLTRLVDRKLIARQRAGRARKITVTLLRPDGTGEVYTRPGRGNSDRFLKLSNVYWTQGWYAKLDLPATAMLLVALHEKPGFELVTEKVPNWYGWSADTAERGLTTLQDLDLVTVAKRTKKAPLAPSGVTTVNVYTLTGPFAHPESTPQATSTKKRRKPPVRITKTAGSRGTRPSPAPSKTTGDD
ncbi:MAG: hypothetical protein J0H73_13585 [Salana multivorans]|uniref:hypothetical protein n=1 Tax=Salana multivorans TaxID=120377 RepID=UPI00095D7C78|nr:hypothetical protein [Salana multivorans]MBN8883332.1 hypothetical protein [Salana multivorans]OJX98419.1 MAG: hypothetical protein BGO96_04455 [Micrococcales bacterium 73-15]